MKLEEIFRYLNEQEEEDPNIVNQPDDEFINDDPEEVTPEEPTPEEPTPEEPTPEEPTPEPEISTPNDQDREQHTQTVHRRLSAIDKVKVKWKENPEGIPITEQSMSDAITFFNGKKNNLKQLTGRNDIPQLYALQLRFPDFPGGVLGSVRDIQTYSWVQINFFMERYIETTEPEIIPENNIVIQVPGQVNLADKLPEAYALWENRRTKLYNAGGVTVMRIISKDESISLGGLQQCLLAKHKGSFSDTSNNWCTTETDSSNLYTNYRSYRSFYYVLNKNVPENSDYRIFAIGAVEEEHGSYPFTLTGMYNNPNEIKNLTLEEIASRTACPQLLEIKDQIKWFEETKVESIERIYDSYTFDGRFDSDFAFLRPADQYRYIETGRNIKSGKALKALGEVTIPNMNGGKPMDLQKEYARRTINGSGLGDYRHRFNTQDPTEDPFEMISSLRPKVKKFLDNVILKTQQGITDGIYSIVASVLNESLVLSWRDYTRQDIRLFQSKNTAGLFGIYNLEGYSWEKPLKYTKQSAKLYINAEDRQKYVMLKYVSDNDYFYWKFKKEDFVNKNKNNPNYLRGKYLPGGDGDSVISKLSPM